MNQARLPVHRLFSRRRAIAWIILWSSILIVFVGSAARFSEEVHGTLTGTIRGSSEIVRSVLVDHFTTALAFPTAVVWDGSDRPTEETDAKWQEIQEKLRSYEGVSQITDCNDLVEHKSEPGWHAAFIALNAQNYAEAEKRIEPIRAVLDGIEFHGAHRPYVTGGPAVFIDLNLASTNALRQAEWIALPITLFILLIVFRSAVAAVLPIMVASLGVILTLGILRKLTHLMTMTFFVPNLVTMLGLGVGIDYCLIYLARYRRERAITTTQEAIRITAATAGRTVLASAVLVMSGFFSLLLIPMECFTSIALAGVFVVASVAAATLSLLPAILLLLGRRLEWGRVRLITCEDKLGDLATWWSKFVIRRPWICFISGLVLLDLMALPVLKLEVGAIKVTNLPGQMEARMGYESLNAHFGTGWLMPTVIFAKHTSDQWMGVGELNNEKTLIDKLKNLQDTLDVISVEEAVGTRHQQQQRMGFLTNNKDATEELILVLCRIDPESIAARKWLDKVQSILMEEQTLHPEGTKYYLGGLPSLTLETDRVILRSLPFVVAATLLTTFVLLVIFMRSIFVPLKAIALNLLCVLASYGFLVFCYQTHLGHWITQIPNAGGINSFVLVICFCALFGLSMDYEVFILASVREIWLDSHDIYIAIQVGLKQTSGIITSAALIMISVFMSFAFAGIVETQQLGLGLSLAVFLDATVIRLLCVPSAMVLMGRWNFWWPRFSKANRRRS